MKKKLPILLAAILFTGSLALADKPVITEQQKKEAKQQIKDLREGRIPKATPAHPVNTKAVKDAVEKAQRENAEKKKKEAEKNESSSNSK